MLKRLMVAVVVAGITGLIVSPIFLMLMLMGVGVLSSFWPEMGSLRLDTTDGWLRLIHASIYLSFSTSVLTNVVGLVAIDWDKVEGIADYLRKR